MPCRRLALAASILLSACCLAGAAASPRISSSRHFPPAASQRAEIVTDGSTSRLAGHLDVAKVRDPDPSSLYCGDFVSRQTSGYAWYCSRHWAIKSDLGDDGAAGILLLLELAWPHYAELFGAIPRGSDSMRLALVVGSSRDSLKRAMIDDGMFAFTLGGVTQEGYAASYLYAGAPYQTRYIVLHEATHLYQYCLSGDTRGCYGFFVEGIADFLSSHVFDSAAGSLAVNVLDRAPIHNHLADGLAEWRGRGKPTFSSLYGNAALSRPLSVLLVAFLQSTPEYREAWRKYCRRIVGRDPGAPSKAASDALLDELYGGAGKLDAPFARWIGGLEPTFRLVQRDFDQDGQSFVSGEPASPGAPAILEGRSDRCDAISVRWRQTPDKGSFARVEFTTGADGASPVSLVVSNSGNSASAFLEIGGKGGKDLGGRRLAERLRRGEAVTFDGFPAILSRRWRISASQPGVEFTLGDSQGNKIADMADAPGKFTDGRGKAGTLAPAKCSGLEPVTGWKALGPFALPDGKFAHPQQAPLMADLNGVAVLDDGTFAAWRDAAANRNAVFADLPIVNITRTFGRQANNSFAYAVANIESAGGGEVEISLGVSDGVEAFLNGEKVFDDVRRREWQEGNARFRATLRPGANELLLRLTHGCGVWLLSGNQRKVAMP